MKVLILEADNWVGFFIEGKLIDEGHSLGEGDGIVQFLKEKADEYGFGLSEVEEKHVIPDDEEYLYAMGAFPKNLNQLKGTY